MSSSVSELYSSLDKLVRTTVAASNNNSTWNLVPEGARNTPTPGATLGWVCHEYQAAGVAAAFATTTTLHEYHDSTVGILLQFTSECSDLGVCGGIAPLLPLTGTVYQAVAAHAFPPEDDVETTALLWGIEPWLILAGATIGANVTDDGSEPSSHNTLPEPSLSLVSASHADGPRSRILVLRYLLGYSISGTRRSHK